METRPLQHLSVPPDFSAIRGANYCAAGGNHNDHWNNYDPKETARDLDYARRIGINQVRVFLSYPAYTNDKEKFKRNLQDLAATCAAKGIGLMPVVPASMPMVNEASPYPLSREWVKELLDTIGKAPALAMWDVKNEPDYPNNATSPARIAHARAMAKLFKELDTREPKTPVTIGFAFEGTMEQNGDVVDVLSFHDYLTTRSLIRNNIAKAKAYAAKAGKPLINTEIGCVARANPYDVCIEEYSKANVGFYMWELMITGYWGEVHGIVYPDGTVRDPSIVAAMQGFFRNRSDTVILEQPDKEGAVTRILAQGKTWLAAPNGTYEEGIRVAEVASNLLEAGQLIPMRELPSRRVIALQKNHDPAALKTFATQLLASLQPYQRDPGTPGGPPLPGARGRGRGNAAQPANTTQPAPAGR
jgi:hypothetical protein